ncbi:MAG: uracil-DNA glycosylase family protein [Candidatus Cryptobacteroides sp.]
MTECVPTSVPATERHPLEPFLPQGAKILLLGSFPPKRERWSMDFFYPNFINDMWRIMGHIFFNDKEHFISGDGGRPHFDKAAVEEFCTREGIALYDTATVVRRLRDNASDQFLEIVERTDIAGMLAGLPSCRAVVSTGGKSASALCGALGCEVPPVGGMTRTEAAGRTVDVWRMPSTSRAYPLAFEKKAEEYRKMFEQEKLLSQL